MPVTYLDTDNSATAGQNLGAAGTKIKIHSLVVGKPTNGKIITLYNTNNPGYGDTKDIAFQYTYPTMGAGKPARDQIKLNLPLDAGAVITDAGLQLTVFWDYV